MKKSRIKEVYTLADLRNWSDAARSVTSPIRLGVFGDPVAHSLSPQIQNAALQHCKLEMQYARFQIHPSELKEAMRLLVSLKFVGANITVPHKVAAVELVDDLDAEAKEIRALNTIVVRDDDLIGANSDGIGFSRAIRSEFSVDLRDLRILLLGAGGAARAIALQCARDGCERLVIANRTAAKAKEIADGLRDYFAGPRVLGPVPRLQAIPFEETGIRPQIANVDLIVNATPLGMQQSDPVPIAPRLLAPHLMIYDTVYRQNGAPTALVTAAGEAGARAANGLSMLLHQAARSFEFWFGRPAPIDAMRQAL